MKLHIRSFAFALSHEPILYFHFIGEILKEPFLFSLSFPEKFQITNIHDSRSQKQVILPFQLILDHGITPFRTVRISTIHMRIYVLLNQYGDKISETWKEVYTFTFTNHIDFLHFTNFPNRLLHESIILNHKIPVTSKHKVKKQMIIL